MVIMTRAIVTTTSRNALRILLRLFDEVVFLLLQGAILVALLGWPESNYMHSRKKPYQIGLEKTL
jgi:hypothetical protein